MYINKSWFSLTSSEHLHAIVLILLTMELGFNKFLFCSWSEIYFRFELLHIMLSLKVT